MNWPKGTPAEDLSRQGHGVQRRKAQAVPLANAKRGGVVDIREAAEAAPERGHVVHRWTPPRG
jgi:hypothetical protein